MGPNPPVTNGYERLAPRFFLEAPTGDPGRSSLRIKGDSSGKGGQSGGRISAESRPPPPASRTPMGEALSAGSFSLLEEAERLQMIEQDRLVCGLHQISRGSSVVQSLNHIAGVSQCGYHHKDRVAETIDDGARNSFDSFWDYTRPWITLSCPDTSLLFGIFMAG